MIIRIVVILLICLMSALPSRAQFYYSSDSRQTTLESYIKKIQHEIKENIGYYKAKRNYQVKIGLTLDKLGNINDIRTLESSGSESFDYNMTQIIVTASPFDPLPYSYQGKEISFIIDIIAKDVIVNCPYFDSIQKQNAMMQQLDQADKKRQEQERQAQQEKQRIQNQAVQGVNSIINRFVPRF